MSRFRAVKSEEEERQSLEGVIPCNTRYSTRWARKIFEEWQTNRGNSSAVNEPTSLTFENKSDIQELNTRLEDLRAESLNFWLIKFVQEVGSVSHLKMYTDDLLMSSVSRIQTLMIY